MAPIEYFNVLIAILFTVSYVYQVVFFIIGAIQGQVQLPAASRLHRYAFFIAAHNEEAVIANLVSSIKDQDYPTDLIDVFVVADACTDNTAQVARDAGAIVYERHDLARKGKSWVMDFGFKKILEDYPGRYEAYFIFDADNLLSKDYVRIMNDGFDQGFQVLTSYRNSKNFGHSWISAAYSIWFIREARFLNNARMLLNTSCAVSGSGYLISARIVEAMRGWDFHTLTEDIQLSSFCAIHGIRIGYTPAEFYDEQPLTLSASIKQRRRWVKGFYQVFFTYGKQLVQSVVKHHSFAAFDLLMVIAPATLLSLTSLIANGSMLLVGTLTQGFLVTDAEMTQILGSIVLSFLGMYVTYFSMALTTTILEYKHIHCRSKLRILSNLFAFPLFMFTYIPLTVTALFLKVDWIPTPHDVSVTLEEVLNK
ncbi:glycosyltransferase [Collinsella sp. zg1085]|uniref:glycosyltransferase family 2 protein n=1 Tax=Collinsella sp. zg1085 TaxID=2844380 RepID=UPI001C0D15B4|nr:glycosyltransferase family 2 protein [Collinsella sp. zg1085]QWT17096.1 glycosyltransferase [Collinsella sp. zg1085]